MDKMTRILTHILTSDSEAENRQMRNEMLKYGKYSLDQPSSDVYSWHLLEKENRSRYR